MKDYLDFKLDKIGRDLISGENYIHNNIWDENKRGVLFYRTLTLSKNYWKKWSIVNSNPEKFGKEGKEFTQEPAKMFFDLAKMISVYALASMKDSVANAESTIFINDSVKQITEQRKRYETIIGGLSSHMGYTPEAKTANKWAEIIDFYNKIDKGVKR